VDVCSRQNNPENLLSGALSTKEWGHRIFVEENRRLIFYYEFGDQEFESLGRAV